MAKFHLNARMTWHKHDDVNHPPVILEAGDHDTNDLPPWLLKRMEDKGFLVALQAAAEDENGADDKPAARKPGRPPKDASGSAGTGSV